MLRMALCDRNRKTARHYAMLIADIAKKHSIEIDMSYFDSGDSLLFLFSESPNHIDILFLDIFIGEIDGIEAARRLRACSSSVLIIFLTDCMDYAYEAFDVGATQYLLKDRSEAHRLERTFLKAAELVMQRKDEQFTFEFDGEITTVPISRIAYFEIWKRLVTVYYGDGETGKFYGCMEQLEKQLSGLGFIRPHRSYLVHFSYISAFKQQKLKLKTGEIIPVGGTYAKQLKKAFTDYISGFHMHGAQRKLDT